MPTAKFRRRALDSYSGISGNAKLTVSRLLWNVRGGCDQADIDIETGDSMSLWDFVGMLRMGVEIAGDFGWCWWGYVHEVVLHFQTCDISFSLDRLFNRVAVAYNLVGAGAGDSGIASETAYTTDALSIAAYGTKDLLLTTDKMTADAALRWRNVKILEYAKPTGSPEPVTNEMVGATLYCRGWWYTLEWRQAFKDYVTSISYTTTGTTHNVGDVAANNKVAQQVTVGGANVNLAEIELYVQKTGDPLDDLRIAVYTVDGSGNPTGDSLFTATVPAALITTSLAWIGFSAEEIELAASTMYSVVIDRVGGVDENNYFSVGVNTAKGYAGGVAKTWDYTDWSAISPDADVLFKVNTNALATIAAQISDMITTYAEFLTLTTNEGSTESQPSYMPGDISVLQALEDFMDQGGANTRRLLATVEQNRTIRIFEEPALPARRYYYQKSGRVYINGRSVVLEDCPYLLGQWIDANEGFITATSYDTLQPQFVDSIEWTPEGGIQARYKGKPAPEDEY